MTAPAEPELDLSHLLAESAVPADGAAQAARTARRRRVIRRVAAGGATVVVLVGAVAAATAMRSNGERTVRTVDASVRARLLATGDVQRVLPEMVATKFKNGREVAEPSPADLRISTPSPRAALIRQWTWRGERTVQGAMPDRVWLVSTTIAEFGDEQSASRFVATVPPDMRVRPLNAIPGAIELVAREPRGEAVVSFPRGRFVYAVMAIYGGNHMEELHQLALRQAELAGSAVTSCPISAPLTGIADALPHEGETTLDHVRQTMTRYESAIRNDFPGVVSLSAGPRNGDVWRGKRGDFTVHRVEDFWIIVHVESPLSCPGDPGALRSYDGVPLHFVVG